MLAVAGVSNFRKRVAFWACRARVSRSPWKRPRSLQFIRQSFYPNVLTASDVSFVTEQGILPPAGRFNAKEILFRLIDQQKRVRMATGRLDVMGWNEP